MKTKCYSVRLKSLIPISDKAFKAVAFDGSSDIIPGSQIYAPDIEVNNSEAYWISAWILEKKTIQYSHKKIAWFDSVTRKYEPEISISKHKPEHKDAINQNIIESLKK